MADKLNARYLDSKGVFSVELKYEILECQPGLGLGGVEELGLLEGIGADLLAVVGT